MLELFIYYRKMNARTYFYSFVLIICLSGGFMRFIHKSLIEMHTEWCKKNELNMTHVSIIIIFLWILLEIYLWSYHNHHIQSYYNHTIVELIMMMMTPILLVLDHQSMNIVTQKLWNLTAILHNTTDADDNEKQISEMK